MAWYLPRLRKIKTIILSSPLRDDPMQRSVHFLEALPTDMMKLIKHVKVNLNFEAGEAQGDCWFFLQGLEGYGLKKLKSLEVKVGGLSSNAGDKRVALEAFEELGLKKKAQKLEVEFQDNRLSWARW